MRQGDGDRRDRREPSFGGTKGRKPQHDQRQYDLYDDEQPQRRARPSDDDDEIYGRSDEDINPAKPRRVARKPSSRPAKPSRSKWSLLGRLFYWGVVFGLWGLVALSGLIAYHASKLPPIDQITIPKRPPNIAIIGSDGTLLANRGETGGREIVLNEVPAYLPKAFIAIEDHRFHNHFGIDPIGIARALVRNVLHAGGGVQGGSTLTQQLAKNLFLTQERTASRKIQEAILALWLERKFTKDQILELYLNRVYFGSGAHGVEAAAQTYFGKSARTVTIAEAAMLAGLVQAPSRLAPNRNPAAAQARAALVVGAMQREGFITGAESTLALAKPAEAVRGKGAGSINYAADHVMDVLDELIGSIDKDILVTTTLNPLYQMAAEKALVEELDAKGVKFAVTQGAFVAMDPDGAVRALVGGRSYAESQYDRVNSAKRQPGSAFKPFVYLGALELGLTPDTIREDAPINVKGWQPENYAKEYKGPVTLTTALSQSLNTVAVRVGLEVGPKNVAAIAHRLGIKSKLDVNASIALGTSDVTPMELVSAYASFANGGLAAQPYLITEVISRDGDLVYARPEPAPQQVIDPSLVPEMNRMLRETVVSGTARKAEIPGWDVAGKTGTSQDFRDAWFIGYTNTLVAGVWLGNDDNSPTKHVAGGGLPTAIWARFMKTALAQTAPTPLPGGNSSIPALFSGWKLPWDTGGTQPAVPLVPPAPIGQEPKTPPASQPVLVKEQAQTDGLRPPGDIPTAGANVAKPKAKPKGFFDSLFGQ